MCDALGANTLDIKGLIESNYLAHALVKFIDLESISPYDLSRPINDLTQVFENDKKTQGMRYHDRLKHHQKNSKAILDKLKIWMKNQLNKKNSFINLELKFVQKYRNKLPSHLDSI